MVLLTTISVVLAAEPAAPAWEAVRGSSVTYEGDAVRLAGPGGAAMVTRSLTGDWVTAEALVFDVVAERPAIFEVRAGSDAWFWRKVEVPAGETTVTLPLAWWRWSDVRVPRWDAVDGLVVSLREPAEIHVSGVRLVAGGSARSPQLGPEDVAALLPDATVSETAAAAIVTNAPELDVVALAEHLARVEAAVRGDLPFLAPLEPPPLLVVARDREGQLAFVQALAVAWNAKISPPRSDGFTPQGVATGSWSSSYGTMRPTFTHEYVHALVDRAGGVADHRTWLPEGLAAMYQLEFHPEADPGGPIDVPLLRRLCSGGEVSTTDYAVAAWVARALIVNHASELEALFAAMRSARSTDLGPHLGPILGTDWDGLSREIAALRAS